MEHHHRDKPPQAPSVRDRVQAEVLPDMMDLHHLAEVKNTVPEVTVVS